MLYFGHVVLLECVSIDSSKIEVMLDWQRSKTIIEVQKFLGLVRYYRKFVKGFYRLARPLLTLTKKETQFQWSHVYEESFQKLKKRLSTILILALLKDEFEYDLYTDASRSGLWVVLLQQSKVIVYVLRQLKDFESRYSTNDSKLAIIMFVLKILRLSIQGKM